MALAVSFPAVEEEGALRQVCGAGARLISHNSSSDIRETPFPALALTHQFPWEFDY